MPARAPAAAVARVVLLAILATGCGANEPSGSAATSASRIPGPPTPPPAFGLTWAQIEDVERPEAAFAIPSDLPTAPSGPGTAGHPGHFPGQSILADVATQGDRLVAVGFTFAAGAWTADAWTSTDAVHWSLASIDTQPGSFATSVAAAAQGGFVAVGRVGSTPSAWTSADGAAWLPATVARLASGARAGEPERIETVLATDRGLIAGGSAGPELGERRARLWRSDDGTAWLPIADSDAFEGAEAVAAAWTEAGGFVVVGRVGTGQRATGSVAWHSADGDTWLRDDDPDLARGLVAAVTAVPVSGWLAVGSDGDEREAVAWSSPDGIDWQRAPSEASRVHAGEKVRMTDVVLTRDGLVGIGNFVGVQFGEGTSWLSADGVAWRQAPIQASLGQGEPEAVVAWHDRLVMVGSRGAPDNYIPTAWVSPGAS